MPKKKDLNALKRRVAIECIDLTGERNGNAIVRIFRDGTIDVGYHENGEDGYSDKDRLWFSFPIFYDENMSSANRKWGMGKDEYIDSLVNELTKRNSSFAYMRFNKAWGKFTEALEKWRMSKKESA
jgi:hypothetical protein